MAEVNSESGLAMCQKDAYVRSLSATVLSCEPVPEAPPKKAKKGEKKETPIPKWMVVLSDTVIYPEGGGQPSDFGTLNGAQVSHVEKKNGAFVHMCAAPQEVGSEVEVIVDWNRRFDHMQQHTGQHAISAVADRLCNAPTVSWELSTEYVNVELAPEGELTASMIDEVEKQANEEIRLARAVNSLVLDGMVENAEPAFLRGKLPPVGTHKEVRLVQIEGLDVNACGGTHVKSLAELQMLKVLRIENAKGNTRVVFAVGGRALSLLSSCLARQNQITKLLSCNAEEHLERIEKMVDDKKDSVKRIKSLSEELALIRGKALGESPSGVVIHHQTGADLPFLQSIATAAQEVNPNALYFLTAENPDVPADKKRDVEGIFLLVGPANLVDEAGKSAISIVGGRGGGRGGKMQGKATNLEKREDVLPILEEAMQKLSV
ncbi:hypothetical protein CYMTET_13653 [Cymbomonas tetramitiformis]|uniref:Alanyl-transfer RNA synthetases family profile domain-containing protein n=1 Tax=Cymbomonas tetramitiformis TaxID=36881 RepID=A0AAE0GI12_9CHLO|nr:hypothetical protein CYMTET_13653 [Cymbomonas tetramitiformis]|eukprot:gene26379-32355_t